MSNRELNYQLTVPFSKFEIIINEKIKDTDRLQSSAISTEEEIKLFEEEYEKWYSECIAELKKSFSTENNPILRDFKVANSASYNFNGREENVYQKAKKLKETITAKQQSLWGDLKILSVSDALISPEKLITIPRDNYTIEEKLEMIMDKFYELYDDNYYPLTTILINNGIKLKRFDEDRELGKILEENGFVEINHAGHGVYLRLTTYGAMQVEENKKKIVENYDNYFESKEFIETRFNEIVSELKKLGLGQEIIYEEMEELKDLYGKVNKKTWAQLLKGKLVDMALGQVLDVDSIKFVYESLTNSQLRLP